MYMDWTEIKTMLKGWSAAILFGALVVVFLYLSGPSTSTTTYVPQEDYSKEIQEAIDRVDREIEMRSKYKGYQPFRYGRW